MVLVIYQIKSFVWFKPNHKYLVKKKFGFLIILNRIDVLVKKSLSVRFDLIFTCWWAQKILNNNNTKNVIITICHLCFCADADNKSFYIFKCNEKIIYIKIKTKKIKNYFYILYFHKRNNLVSVLQFVTA